MRHFNLEISDEGDVEVRDKAPDVVVHLRADRHGVGEHEHQIDFLIAAHLRVRGVK